MSKRQTPRGQTPLQVKDRYEADLLSHAGVVGIGVGDCKGVPCIKVYVEKLIPDLQRQIPKQLEGIPVDPEETGPIEAY